MNAHPPIGFRGFRRPIAPLYIVLLGCTGTIGEGPSAWEPPPFRFEEGVVDFECGEPDTVDAPLRRLSRTQLDHTVRDVLTELLGDDAPVALAEVAAGLAAVPSDQRSGAAQDGQLLFFRSDQAVGQGAVAAHYQLGVLIGRSLGTDARLDAMGFGCATNDDATDDAGCLDTLVSRIGELTHRRPLADDEFNFYRRQAYDGDVIDRELVAELITKLFVQPNFMFHVEGVGELTANEAASRLSYHLWNTMPDSWLRESAASGRLLTDEGWSEAVERLVGDVRIEQSVRPFLLEWFRFDQLFPASSGRGADFEAIAGELDLDEGFDQAVEDELVDLYIHTLRSGGTFEDFFMSSVTTTNHPVLASFYGVEPAASGSVVEVPPARRSVLTRIGLLLARAEVALPTINSITHPILRGVFIRRQITCDDLQAAPGGAMDDLPTVDRTTTGSREATEILTGAQACSGCHGRINPTGYVFEGFDAIGRERRDEPLFDSDGNETMRLPLDTSAEVLESDESIASGAELARVLYDSEKVGACFARHYFRFTSGRSENVDANGDGCALSILDEAIDAGEPLRDVITQTLLEASFRQRAEPGETR